MCDADIERLDGVALEYEFCRAMGKEVFGRHGGSFVVRGSDGSLGLFEAEDDPVSRLSLCDSDVLYPLDVARKLDASFVAIGGVVTCRIGKVEAEGNSYSEAAMRAVVAYVDAGGVVS